MHGNLQHGTACATCMLVVIHNGEYHAAARPVVVVVVVEQIRTVQVPGEPGTALHKPNELLTGALISMSLSAAAIAFPDKPFASQGSC